MQGDPSFAGFLALVSFLCPNGAHLVPPADASDAVNGATKIPSRVTDARRAGQTVGFVQVGGEEGWYWLMPGGEQIPY